jgi:choline dehydrogenase
LDTPRGVAPFTNHLPVRVRFGAGAAVELGAVAAAHGARRVLLVVDHGLPERNAAVAEAIAALQASDVAVHSFAKPPGEPTIDVVDTASAAVATAAPEAIVAVGGGSVIDTAKAARACAQQRIGYRELVTRPSLPDPVVPLIAVPTTAGTGSEVSGGAVVTDAAATRKAGIASPALRAHAQAMAGMLANARTPIGDAIALESIRLIAGSLVAAVRDGGDEAARSDMACGSLLAGLTMNISDCTAEHSLGQAIGGMFHAPHGLTIGVVLVQALERERRLVPGQLERIADALGVADDGTADGSRAVLGVRELLAELRFPVLRSIGVDETHVETLTELALADPFHTRSSEPWTATEIRGAFVAALAEAER